MGISSAAFLRPVRFGALKLIVQYAGDIVTSAFVLGALPLPMRIYLGTELAGNIRSKGNCWTIFSNKLW